MSGVAHPDPVIENLMEAVLHAGADRVIRHTIRLARVPIDPDRGFALDDFSGAGVLIERGKAKGIITAAHNIVSKKEPSQRIANTEMLVLISMSPNPSRPPRMEAIRIPLLGAKVQGGNRRDGTGPDIAWIPLTPDTASTIEARTGVFYRLDDGCLPDTSDEADAKVELNEAVPAFLVSGFSVEREQAAFAHGEKASFGHTCSIGPVMKAWTDGGWDYERRCIDLPSGRWTERRRVDETVPVPIRKVVPVHPDYLGGLSGAGVWRLWQPPGDHDKDAVLHRLVGMVYFQDRGKGPQGEITMINHGAESLRRIIDPASPDMT